MRFNEIATRAGKFASDNSPTILAALSVAGVVSTAYLTGKACFKAAEIIQAEENAEKEILTTREKIELTWIEYVPAVTSGIATVAFIVAANRVGTRRAAAMAAAYAISERAYEEYRDKIVEKLGDRKERAARDEIAQSRVTSNPPPEDLVLLEDGRSVLCCDLFTGRYFLSDMETLRKAQNDINYMINNNYYASLSDFYDAIGLDRTSMSDDFGWNADKLLELHFSTALTPSGKPCLTFDFKVLPIRGYSRLQ